MTKDQILQVENLRARLEELKPTVEQHIETEEVSFYQIAYMQGHLESAEEELRKLEQYGESMDAATAEAFIGLVNISLSYLDKVTNTPEYL